jgi:hypothetical protein
LQRSAEADSAAAPTALPPVLPSKSSPRTAVSSSHSASRTAVDPAGSLVTSSEFSRESTAKLKADKPLVQPPWVDDVKVADPLAGRGKGRTKEAGTYDAGGVKTKRRPNAASKSLAVATGSADDSSLVGEGSVAQNSPVMKDRVVYPVPSPDMTHAEKVTVQLISKARGKMMGPEEARKPLTKSERALLKRYNACHVLVRFCLWWSHLVWFCFCSPLAVPLVKPQPGDLELSPREKAKRNPAKPVVDSNRRSPRLPQTGSPRSPKKGVSQSRTQAAGTADGAAQAGLTDALHSRSSSSPGSASKADKEANKGTLPALSPPNSPMRAASGKDKKKSILRALNGKSNPGSPRDGNSVVVSDSAQAGAVTDGGGDTPLFARLDSVQRALVQSFSAAAVEAAHAHTHNPCECS